MTYLRIFGGFASLLLSIVVIIVVMMLAAPTAHAGGLTTTIMDPPTVVDTTPSQTRCQRLVASGADFAEMVRPNGRVICVAVAKDHYPQMKPVVEDIKPAPWPYFGVDEQPNPDTVVVRVCEGWDCKGVNPLHNPNADKDHPVWISNPENKVNWLKYHKR